VIVYSASDIGELERCLEEARSSDLVVKASGVGAFDELLEEAVPTLRRNGNIVAYWDVDAPATLCRIRANPLDPFRVMIPKYDVVFTYGGGSPVVSSYLHLDARSCVPIYNALDPETHYPVPSDPELIGDVGFLGNRLPDREPRVDEFFFRPAELRPECKFVLGGCGWEDKRMPRNVSYLGHVSTARHNSFNSSQMIVMNINRQSMADTGFSPPTRIFEAAGAAACIVTDVWDGIQMFLEPEKEILVVGDGVESAELVKLITPSEAVSIGRRARRRVMAEHTYTHRARDFEESLGITNRRFGRPLV
jgi:spore maturation protein CgeB